MVIDVSREATYGTRTPGLSMQPFRPFTFHDTILKRSPGVGGRTSGPIGPRLASSSSSPPPPAAAGFAAAFALGLAAAFFLGFSAAASSGSFSTFSSALAFSFSSFASVIFTYSAAAAGLALSALVCFLPPRAFFGGDGAGSSLSFFTDAEVSSSLIAAFAAALRLGRPASAIFLLATVLAASSACLQVLCQFPGNEFLEM